MNDRRMAKASAYKHRHTVSRNAYHDHESRNLHCPPALTRRLPVQGLAQAQELEVWGATLLSSSDCPSHLHRPIIPAIVPFAAVRPAAPSRPFSGLKASPALMIATEKPPQTAAKSRRLSWSGRGACPAALSNHPLPPEKDHEKGPCLDGPMERIADSLLLRARASSRNVAGPPHTAPSDLAQQFRAGAISEPDLPGLHDRSSHVVENQRRLAAGLSDKRRCADTSAARARHGSS